MLHHVLFPINSTDLKLQLIRLGIKLKMIVAVFLAAYFFFHQVEGTTKVMSDDSGTGIEDDSEQSA